MRGEGMRGEGGEKRREGQEEVKVRERNGG